MSSFKVALKDVVSKLHWKFQITVLEICAQWSSIQRFRAAMKQTSVRNIWSASSDFELQSDKWTWKVSLLSCTKTKWSFTSSPSKVQVKKFSSKFPSAFFTSESRSWLSTYEVENIGWFILKFNFLSVFSTKSPMLSEVAGPCRSSSWQKQEVSNEVPLPTEKAKCAKIHTATSSAQFYLLSGRSSSCALPSWSPIHRICPSILSVEAWDLTTQYWSCFTRSSSSWRLQSNSNCKYILPAAVRTK